MKTKEIKAYVGADMLGVVDRLFKGDMLSIVSELAQNARRAGAGNLEVTRTRRSDGSYRVEVRDDGIGIADPRILLGLRDSAWQSDDVLDEDPAGMGFFVLSGCPRSGVASLDWRMDNLTPEVFAGRDSATVEYEQTLISGTVVWFECPASMVGPCADSSLRRFLSLCGMKVKLDGKAEDCAQFGSKYKLDTYEIAAKGSFEDLGVSYICIHTISDTIRPRTTRYNFFGFEGVIDMSRVLGSDHFSPVGAGCSMYVELHNARSIKPVLPARKELVVNDALVDLCMRLDKVAFGLVNSKQHFLPFDKFSYAVSIGVDMRQAASCLVPVNSLSPFDADENFVRRHGKGVSPTTHALVTWPCTEKTSQRMPVMLARWLDNLRWNPDDMPIDLVWSRRGYKGYGWYDAMPVCHIFQCVGNEVFVEEEAEDTPVVELLTQAGYTVISWGSCEGLPSTGDTKVVSVTVDPGGRHMINEQSIPAVIDPTQDVSDYYGSLGQYICVASESYDVSSVVEWITEAIKEEDFNDCDDDSDAAVESESWDNACLADIRLRLQSPHEARKDVFERFLIAARDALDSSAVSGLGVDQCAVKLTRDHGSGAAWSCRWRHASSLDNANRAGPRTIVVEANVVQRTVVVVPEAHSLGDALHKARQMVSNSGGAMQWDSELESTLAFEQGTAWTKL